MRFWKWLLAMLVVYLAVSAGAGFLLCDMAVHPGRKPLNAAAQSKAEGLAAKYQASLEEAAILQRDGAICKAWYFRNLQGRHRGAALVLHGLSDNRSGMMGYIDLFLANGYSVLAPDSRMHGESGGSLATYGLLERQDVFLWLDWIHEKEPDEPVFALGESMGAAILLQSLEAGAQFRAVVSEASFSNFREMGCDRISQKLHLPLSVGRYLFLPAVEFGFFRGMQKYHLDLRRVAPEGVCAVSSVPILMIHSRADQNIPFRHALRIHEACGNRIEFWPVSDGGHASTLGKHRAEFTSRVLQFFERHR